MQKGKLYRCSALPVALIISVSKLRKQNRIINSFKDGRATDPNEILIYLGDNGRELVWLDSHGIIVTIFMASWKEFKEAKKEQ